MSRIAVRADYATARAAAYPPIGDQLDAVAKLAAALRDAKALALPPEVEAWLADLETVKARHPKR